MSRRGAPPPRSRSKGRKVSIGEQNSSMESMMGMESRVLHGNKNPALEDTLTPRASTHNVAARTSVPPVVNDEPHSPPAPSAPKPVACHHAPVTSNRAALPPPPSLPPPPTFLPGRRQLPPPPLPSGAYAAMYKLKDDRNSVVTALSPGGTVRKELDLTSPGGTVTIHETVKLPPADPTALKRVKIHLTTGGHSIIMLCSDAVAAEAAIKVARKRGSTCFVLRAKCSNGSEYALDGQSRLPTDTDTKVFADECHDQERAKFLHYLIDDDEEM